MKNRRGIIPGAPHVSLNVLAPLALQYNPAYVHDFSVGPRSRIESAMRALTMMKVLLRGKMPGIAIVNARRRGRVAWVAAVAALQVGVASAEEIETTLVAEVRQEIPAPNGRKLARLIPATTLNQGQEIFYTVRIRNAGAVPVRDVEVVQRIPANTTYVPESATGPGAEVSLSADGGITFGQEGTLAVTEQPTPVQVPSTRPATVQDYTHVRWRLRNALAPGAVALARFRAVFR